MRMDEWLRWLLPTERPPDVRRVDLERIDERLTSLEHEQNDIEVRLRLLERQSDPRGIREADGG